MKKFIFFLCLVFLPFMANSAMVLGLPFNETQGSEIKDSSGLNNASLITGTPIWSAGKFNNSLSFNGSTHFRIVNSTSLNPKRISISFWVNPSASNQGAILSKLWASNGAWPWYEYSVVNYNGQIVFYLSAASSSYIINGPKLTSGTWSHVAITHDGTNVRIYLNGVLNKTSAAPVLLTSKATEITIGNDGNGPYGFFKGSIDELRIHDEAISAEKVVSDMNSPIVAAETNPPTAVNFVSFSPGKNAIVFNWNNSIDDSGIAGYEITKYSNSSSIFVLGNTYTDTGLTLDTSYFYTIRSKDINGNFSEAFPFVGKTLALQTQTISISYLLEVLSPTNSVLTDQIKEAVIYKSTDGVNFTPFFTVAYPISTIERIDNSVDTYYKLLVVGTNGLKSDFSNTILVTNSYILNP